MRALLITLWSLIIVAGLPVSAQTCVFEISPSSANFSAAGGNDIINIALASGPSSCARTATSNASWISISFGSPGTGNGTVGFTVSSNQFTVERTGTLTVAGKTFTVYQAAGTCNYSLTPSSVSVTSAGITNTFTLNVASNGCQWSAVSNNPDWLTVVSGAAGSGAGTVRYTVAMNTATATRTGTISIAGLTFTVTQTGVCGYTLSPTSITAPNIGTTGSFTVTASSSTCAWTAVPSASWITLTGTTAATGNATVAYTVAANSTLQDRTGSVTIGASGFSVFQPGSACTFTLSAISRSFPSEGGTGSFFVNSTCPWTPNTDAPWITITTQPSTTGNGTVSYLVSGNTDTAQRTGYINVGNRSHSVLQAGVPCSVSLLTTSASVPADGGTGSIHVIAGGGCAWTAAAIASWVSLNPASGSGESDISFTVQPNTGPQARTAVVTVANRTFTISQQGASCDFQIAPAQAAFPPGGGTGSLAVQTTCGWTASATATWIALTSATSGTGPGTLQYTVSPNTLTDARSGVIRISGNSVTISQSGKDCSVSVAPTAVELAGRGGSATVTVSGSKGCRWQPSKDAEWIGIPSWSAVDGSGAVTIEAPGNPNAAARFGSVSLGGQGIAVAQLGLEVLLNRNGIVNAASFAPGPVAPGEIVTIFGTMMGPADLVKLAVAPDGAHIEKKLAETQVLFDGVPAPLIYVSAGQISAVVPYAVGSGGRTTTEVRVVNQGVLSDPVQTPVAAASPALFTVEASGRGQAAVLNQDNTVNSATNAAARNSVIQIFATGEGATTPAGDDGKIASGATLPRPTQGVTVTIGGQNATVTYSGAAPGAVAGLFQVNARIPQNVTPGAAVPVILRVGQVNSPAGVTIAVR